LRTPSPNKAYQGAPELPQSSSKERNQTEKQTNGSSSTPTKAYQGKDLLANQPVTSFHNDNSGPYTIFASHMSQGRVINESKGMQTDLTSQNLSSLMKQLTGNSAARPVSTQRNTEALEQMMAKAKESIASAEQKQALTINELLERLSLLEQRANSAHESIMNIHISGQLPETPPKSRVSIGAEARIRQENARLNEEIEVLDQQ